MNRVNVFAIHRCKNEGYGLIRIFTEKIRISPTKLWRVCIRCTLNCTTGGRQAGREAWSERGSMADGREGARGGCGRRG